MSEKQQVIIYKVISLTSNRRHAWVETNFGRMKKPTSALADSVALESFLAREKELNK